MAGVNRLQIDSMDYYDNLPLLVLNVRPDYDRFFLENVISNYNGKLSNSISIYIAMSDHDDILEYYVIDKYYFWVGC